MLHILDIWIYKNKVPPCSERGFPLIIRIFSSRIYHSGVLDQGWYGRENFCVCSSLTFHSSYYALLSSHHLCMRSLYLKSSEIVSFVLGQPQHFQDFSLVFIFLFVIAGLFYMSVVLVRTKVTGIYLYCGVISACLLEFIWMDFPLNDSHLGRRLRGSQQNFYLFFNNIRSNSLSHNRFACVLFLFDSGAIFSFCVTIPGAIPYILSLITRLNHFNPIE